MNRNFPSSCKPLCLNTACGPFLKGHEGEKPHSATAAATPLYDPRDDAPPFVKHTAAMSKWLGQSGMGNGRCHADYVLGEVPVISEARPL